MRRVRVVEDSHARLPKGFEGGIEVVYPQHDRRHAELVHGAWLPIPDRLWCSECEQGEAQAVALEEDGALIYASQPQQLVRLLPFHAHLREWTEAQQVPIETHRTLEIGDADADVPQAQNGHDFLPLRGARLEETAEIGLADLSMGVRGSMSTKRISSGTL